MSECWFRQVVEDLGTAATHHPHQQHQQQHKHRKTTPADFSVEFQADNDAVDFILSVLGSFRRQRSARLKLLFERLNTEAVWQDLVDTSPHVLTALVSA